MIVELFTSGVEGIPVSYSPRTDDTIALTLLVCFFLSSIALAKGKKFLSQQVKDFVLHRERTSIFDSSTAAALSAGVSIADLRVVGYHFFQLFS